MTQVALENQYGEVSINTVLPAGAAFLPLPAQAANTVVANNTGSSAVPTAVTVQALSNALPAKTGVTAISAIPSPVTAITIALSTSNTYSDAAVNTAVNTALASAVADLQTQLDKINAILAAIKVVS